jgi:hypothetical protein
MADKQWALPTMASAVLAGRGHLDLGDVAAAQKDLAAAREALSHVERFTQVIPFDMQAQMKPGVDELEGEILLAQNKPDAEKMLKDVAEEAAKHRGADALGELFSIERIARVAKARNQVELVKWMAEKMIAFDDAYAAGHFFKGWALAQSHENDAAGKEYGRARALWAHADANLAESTEIRDYLAKVVAGN